jgi:hypothetical protein
MGTWLRGHIGSRGNQLIRTDFFNTHACSQQLLTLSQVPTIVKVAAEAAER